MAVRRSGAPWRSFATRTSVRCPTTSRPRRIQPVRRSSRARLDPSASAARSGPAISAGSRTRRRAPARRANATSRASRSARPGLRPCAFGRGRAPGIPDALLPRSRAPARSRTRTSTARAWRSEPAMASASSAVPGTRTASHSRRTPRATASTGSRLRGRSTHATSAPPAWASAIARRVRVVAPLVPAPRKATVPVLGRPPAARSPSSSAKPVGIARSVSRGASRGTVRGVGASPGRPPGSPPWSGRSAGTAPASAGSGAAASAPKTSVAGRGATDPQRARRLARAATRSAW